MNRKLLLLLLIIIFAKITISITELMYEETDFINIMPNASDPDMDGLTYTYTSPLNEKGEWQTNYGDAGEYTVTVTVSDGELSSSEDVKIIVNKKEAPPVINAYYPEESSVIIDEGSSLDFKVSASDPNNDELSYVWEFDGDKVADINSYSYHTDYYSQGVHTLRVYVTDAKYTSMQRWNIKVNDVDRAELLEQIENIEAKETDTVKLSLPDFKDYKLNYDISEPIGNDAVWETTYDDAGTYSVKIRIYDDKRFNATKDIKVTINNFDRPPIFVPVEDIVIKESQRVTIYLEANDPDNDNITFSAENPLEGSFFEENKFIWYPGYDVVKKDSLWDNIIDKYHLLSESFDIKFIAKGKELKAEMNVKITVKDVNKKPTLYPIRDIIINEGESFNITPKAIDQDGDEIRYSYSGWINQGGYTTNYDDAGTHTITVTASDGLLEDSKDVNIIVNNVNRAPILEYVEDKEVYENETLNITIDVYDPDGDELVFYTDNVSSKDNFISITPDFDLVKGKKTREYIEIGFRVSDGEFTFGQNVTIIVHNVNRAPEIINVSPAEEFIAYRNQPVTFEAPAYDPDGDEITYRWEYGLFEEYEGKDPAQRRIFTRAGNKKVNVIISDGEKETSHEWNIKVV